MEFNLDKYTDKNILIIGGGTSTLDTKWENIDYDYIWTCNDFFLEERVLKQDIDVFLLGYTTNLTSKVLVDKLKDSTTQIFYEGVHYRGKQNTPQFKEFERNINIPIYSTEFFQVDRESSPAALSGATFRMIATALHLKAKTIYFVGFDGWNRDFSNIHAFTKHRGLKKTDTRRVYEGTPESYRTVFEESYKYFTRLPGYERLQNLGEGFDYNIGTEISRKSFPLDPKVKELIKM